MNYSLSDNQKFIDKKIDNALRQSFLLSLAFFALYTTNLKIFGQDRDYLNYVDMYFRYENYEFLEPLPFIISYIGNENFWDFNAFYLTITSIGILTKFFIVWKHKLRVTYFIFIYFLYYFWIVDYTQIRYGAAMPFIILTLIYYQRRQWYFSIAWFAVAVAFHYSSVLLLIPLSIHFLGIRNFLTLTALGLLVALPSGLIRDDIIYQLAGASTDSYIGKKSGHTEDLNLLNTYYASFIAIFIISIYAWRKKMSDLRAVAQYALALGIICYFASITLASPVIGQRILELSSLPTFLAICTSAEYENEEWKSYIFLIPYLYLSIYIHLSFGIIEKF